MVGYTPDHLCVPRHDARGGANAMRPLSLLGGSCEVIRTGRETVNPNPESEPKR